MDEMIKKLVEQMNYEQRQQLIKKLEAEESKEFTGLIGYLKSLV